MANRKGNNKRSQIKKIELALRQYKSYIVGVRNLQKQLDFIMPAMTASYELREGSNGAFVLNSTTEKYAIDRIESKRALDIHDKIRQYELIVGCIDEALVEVNEQEKEFVTYRYFSGWSIAKCAAEMGYSEQNLFLIRKQLMNKLLISLTTVLEFY